MGYEYRATEPDRELTSLSVIDIDTGKVEQTLTPPPKNTLRGVGWADEKRPYYYISGTMHARDALPASHADHDLRARASKSSAPACCRSTREK